MSKLLIGREAAGVSFLQPFDVGRIHRGERETVDYYEDWTNQPWFSSKILGGIGSSIVFNTPVSFFYVFLICRSAHLPCWPNPPSLYPHLAIGVRAIAVKACVIPPPSGEAEEPYKGRVPKLRLLCGLPYHHHHHHLAIHQLFSVEESCWHYHIPVMAILALSRGGPDHKQTGIKLADPLELQSFQLKCCEVVTNVPPEKNIFWVFNFI